MPEQRTSDPGRDDTNASRDLTLGEAAQLYNLSLSTLRRLVTTGSIAAHKVTGGRGREWRISTATLQEAGYLPRVLHLTTQDSAQMETRRLTDALIAERARSADLDKRLGYALLTVGRLRGRLQEAGIDPDQLFGGDLGAEHDLGASGPD